VARDDAVDVREVDVHQHDVGIRVLEQRPNVGPPLSLADDGDVIRRFHGGVHARPDHGVVVDDGDADHALEGVGRVGSAPWIPAPTAGGVPTMLVFNPSRVVDAFETSDDPILDLRYPNRLRRQRPLSAPSTSYELVDESELVGTDHARGQASRGGTARTRAGARRSVVDRVRSVRRPRAVARLLTAVPQPVVKGARWHRQPPCKLLAGVDGAGAQLALLLGSGR